MDDEYPPLPTALWLGTQLRAIIAGSRGISDPMEVEIAIAESGFVPTKVLSGHAGGVDLLGESWAKSNGVPVELYPAEWSRLGRKAGPIRNRLMATRADALVAIWDGRSRGTKNMIETARAFSLKVFVRVMSDGG